ncbi:MAG: transcriptional regulator [Proteobacteria bacterium]|nr:transcriptional regulator [Rhodocyclales bacterium]MCX7135493.1 transcriptional regulator [Pseudomonadota bacterium]
MKTHPRKLLIVIAEAALERQLVADVKRLGAHGYTVIDVRGGGARGDRNADWDADRSIQMEVICDDAVAEAIAEHIHLTYFDDYAVTVFITEVGVLRPAKF